MFDLVIANARLAGHDRPMDIGIADGLIAAIAPGIAFEGPREDLGGLHLCAGLVETHIHLDKACILDRCMVCEGTLAEAVRLTAAAKPQFTAGDVYARGRSVLEKAIGHGTTRMRSFVEVDPRAGLRSFEAIGQLKADFAHMIDLEICVFAQDGLTREMETYALMDIACRGGADLVGGCPYTDPDPARHVELVFALAERHGMAVDFHLDFDLLPHRSNLPKVIAETARRGLGGRVSVGHVTQLSAQPPEAVAAIAGRMADAGIALAVLPATDLFLTGRDSHALVPRGVAPAHILARNGVVAAIASNNVLNPFTPFGDASLVRMANLFANVAQLASDADLESVYSMITQSAARLLGADYGVRVGAPADLVAFEAGDGVSLVREIAPARAGWKRGRKTFHRPPVELLG